MPATVAPLKVTDQEVPLGRPLSEKVTVAAWTKLAVIVAGPLTEAVVEGLVAEANETEGEDEIQEENT